MCLVGPESPTEQARRVFQSFDPEDNGFIPESLLEDVMKALDLVSEPEYKLDPESLGIILLGPFLLEFFPDQDSGIPDSLPVYHYNGLKQSNHNERLVLINSADRKHSALIVAPQRLYLIQMLDLKLTVITNVLPKAPFVGQWTRYRLRAEQVERNSEVAGLDSSGGFG
ncbi:hypothetical protein fugu_010018 [Takifugu bimaculatus]|uniref:EF-hand domain-containing protein n=1 Tax=Takifugu bimaculatus TaxID=433685 RepID=A0A4Z2CEE5_9TELE|nr:hypothetical protein fugu_010018 [Takifugu bimaculatus]